MKKTPETFNLEIKRAYSYSVCYITDFMMHCRLNSMVEDGKTMELVSEAKKFKNKREFQEYIAECREFDRLYMNPNNTIDMLKEAARKQDELDKLNQELEKKPKLSEKAANSREVNRLFMEFLITNMSSAYIKGIVFNFCMHYEKNNKFTTWLLKEGAIIPFLTTFVIRILNAI